MESRTKSWEIAFLQGNLPLEWRSRRKGLLQIHQLAIAQSWKFLIRSRTLQEMQ